MLCELVKNPHFTKTATNASAHVDTDLPRTNLEQQPHRRRMRGETHLRQEKQRSARPRVGVLIPQLEQFGREDGRCKETQEKEAADGQILDILRTRQQLTGRGQAA